MSSSTEALVRDLFAADAAAAPTPGDLTELVVRRVRRRRWTQAACALAASVVVVGGVLITGAGQAQPPPIAALPAVTSRAPAPATAPSSVPVVPGGVADSLVAAYSPAAVAGRSFAFDGIVVAVGPARSNRPGVELPLSGVTFAVQRWFRGGPGATAVVDLVEAGAQDQVSESSFPPYRLGTRLLVSGEPRWGGQALDAAIAWSGGFTRPYDSQTAAAWAAATR